MSKYSILFVCLGNYCRSPLAEGVFRHLLKEQGLHKQITVDSCGLGPWHVGKAPHEGSREVASEHGVSLRGMKGRQIEKSDFSKFNLILAMDRENHRELESLKCDNFSELGLLRSYDIKKSDIDVPDPYYTGDFDEVFDIIHRCSNKLLAELQKRNILRQD